ncbi:MAG TPA: hypothetical protein VLV88_09535 [Terriglobales bacterium]|nr:hypothetical protein [Terriglobales bacterium]
MLKRPNRKRGSFLNLVFGGALLLGLLTLVGPPRAAAGEDECQKRTVHADHELHEAIEHHGWDSKQANHWRNELQAAREFCWDHSHRWWDEDAHRWHTDRDWDDHDHDHPPH